MVEQLEQRSAQLLARNADSVTTPCQHAAIEHQAVAFERVLLWQVSKRAQLAKESIREHQDPNVLLLGRKYDFS